MDWRGSQNKKNGAADLSRLHLADKVLYISSNTGTSRADRQTFVCQSVTLDIR